MDEHGAEGRRRGGAKRGSAGIAADAALGAVAGGAATLVMEAVDTLLHRLEPPEVRQRIRDVRPEGKDPPHLFAQHISQALGGGPIPEGHPAGRAAYYAIGIASGALYGALRGRVPGLAAGRGLAFGLGRFVLEDKVHNPLAGLSAAPTRYPWQAHARQLAVLTTHAVVTDAVMRAVENARAPERDGPGRPPLPNAPGVTVNRVAERSLQSWLAEQFLPVTGMRRAYRSEGALRRSVAEGRGGEPALPSAGMRRRLAVGEVVEGGARVFTVAPRGPSTGHVLYLHGGAYVRDIMAPQWSFVERLVEATGRTVTVPLYPLAPEHGWREIHGGVREAYERLAARAGAERPAVLGDSAGGGLALALAQASRDRGRPLPSALVLVSPWLDATGSDPSQPALARRDRMLDLPGLRAAGRWVARDLHPGDPRISPLFGSLRGLPPIQVFAGSHDLVYPDSRRLAARAAREGARLDYHEYEGQFHVWPLVDLPESRRVIAEIAAFLAGTRPGQARPTPPRAPA